MFNGKIPNARLKCMSVVEHRIVVDITSSFALLLMVVGYTVRSVPLGIHGQKSSSGNLQKQ